MSNEIKIKRKQWKQSLYCKTSFGQLNVIEHLSLLTRLSFPVILRIRHV